MNPIRLKYDGKYPPEVWVPEFGDPRSWTVLSRFVDQDGWNRQGSSFCKATLVELGILKQGGKV